MSSRNGKNGSKPKTYSCNVCNRADNLKMVRCDNCDSWYHYNCVGVTASVANYDWRCQTCSELLASGLIASQQSPEHVERAQRQSEGAMETPDDATSAFEGGAAEEHQSMAVPLITPPPLHWIEGRNNVAGNRLVGVHGVVSNLTSAASIHLTVPGVNGAASSTNVIESAATPMENNSSKSAPIHGASLGNPQIERTARSVRSRVSLSGFCRLREELENLRKDEEISKQKDILLRKRRELLEQQLADEEERCSNATESVRSRAAVEQWLRDSQGASLEPPPIPRAESTLTPSARPIGQNAAPTANDNTAPEHDNAAPVRCTRVLDNFIVPTTEATTFTARNFAPNSASANIVRDRAPTSVTVCVTTAPVMRGYTAPIMTTTTYCGTISVPPVVHTNAARGSYIPKAAHENYSINCFAPTTAATVSANAHAAYSYLAPTTAATAHIVRDFPVPTITPARAAPTTRESATLTDVLLQTVMDKINALELQMTSRNEQSSTQWLPNLPNQSCEFTHIPQNLTAAVVQLTREQIAARHGVNKDLPKFSGHPEEWPLFIASFEQSTALCGFSDGENVHRLRHALEGSARNAVKNLLLHPACVPQILSTLRMKFGRPELIIDVLVSQIRDMPAPKENRLDTIIDFAIEVQNVCATMKASGLLNHLNNPELEKELVGKLPGLLGAFWGMHKITLASCTLENFSDWLLVLAQGANAVALPSMVKRDRKKGVLNTHVEAGAHAGIAHCVVCNGDCGEVQGCRTFMQLNREHRWEAIKKHDLCKICLKPHFPEPCPNPVKCGFEACPALHHPLLHNSNPTLRNTHSNFRRGPRMRQSSVAVLPASATSSSVEPVSLTPSLNVNCNTHCQDGNRILFRILPVILHGNGVQITVFAFFDDGSSLTLIDEELLNALNLKGEPQPLCLRWTANTHRYEDGSQLVNMEISEPGCPKRYPLKNVHSVSKLDLPPQTLDVESLQQKYKHLKGVPLKSYKNAVPRLLIGLNNSRVGVSLKCKEGKAIEPVAEKTRLGWTLKGSLIGNENINQQPSHNMFHACKCDVALNSELLEVVKNYICLDNLDVKPREAKTISDDEKNALDQMEQLTQKIGDRYQTGLLWKCSPNLLPNSLPMARRRALCLLQRMHRDPDLANALQEKLNHYLCKGYARKLNEEEARKDGWYLPVFPVSNPNKPGKLRLVWDAAAKVNNIALNSLLLKGPDQLTSLVSVLRKFRQGRVAIGGDIAEMYHQVLVREEDQQYQRFLWYEPGSTQPTTYVMTVMTFGATCSPSCAQFVKNKNAAEYSGEYPRAAQSIIENHYVDDMLDSVDTEAEAINLARDVHFIHSKGGFEMRNWVSNSQAVLESLGVESTTILNLDADMATEKVLGLWWNTSEDCFVFRVSRRYKNPDVLLGKRRPTKREVLSLVMTIFDPLGLLGFYVMYAKIIFQETWRSKCGWDEEIHDDEYAKWIRWLRCLPEVENLKIPRCYLKLSSNELPELELHTFVDASLNGYAAVSYIRCSYAHAVDCSLIGSKTRVSPLKAMSTPRLELQAAVLGARFAQSLVSTHSLRFARRVFWSDSLNVLSWLRSDHRRYRQFVAFRVSEILELTEESEWRWIPTEENVADEATKWTKIPDFSNASRWLSGPVFLKLCPTDWPQERSRSSASTAEELRAEFVGIHVADVVNILPLKIEPERFSTWKRLFQFTAAFVHLAHIWKSRITNTRRIRGHPLQEEMCHAEELLWKIAQTAEFSDEIRYLQASKAVPSTSAIYKHSPYLDEKQVLRLGGRTPLANGLDPIILPKNHHITQLIVYHYHLKYHHSSHETVVNEIRQRFFISKLRVVVNSVRRKCQICSNERAKPTPPKMAALHPTRLAAFTRPFSYVGVDYFGPMSVSVKRSSEKRYGVLFTCLTTRAIHLELASSLSADSCIISIRNFVARRGNPIEMWSDNGTNFKGAARELSETFAEMDKDKLMTTFTSPSMQWRFIPPSSPHMGGAWERLVRSVKTVLYKIMPSRNPSEELLRGALMEVEMVVNSRPLTYIPINSDEEEALTPNHFLLGSSSGVKPLTNPVSEGILLRKNWQISQQLADAFWKRWVVEYLPIITRRSKWFDTSKPIEVDDLVLIADPVNPRNNWPKGRVVTVRTSPDGVVRSATVKTSTGLYERPAAKIAVLDVMRKMDLVGPQEDIPGGSVANNLAAQRTE